MTPHRAQLFWEIYKNLIIWSIYTYNHTYVCVLGTWIHRDIFTYICTCIYIYIYTLSNRCFFYNLLIQFHEILHLYHIKPFHKILRLLHAFFSCTYICLHMIHKYLKFQAIKYVLSVHRYAHLHLYTYTHETTYWGSWSLTQHIYTYIYIYIYT
jgi:hypothetical protein